MRAAIAALAFLTAIGPVSAATFTAAKFMDGRSAIQMNGTIEVGDAARLNEAMRETPHPVAVILSSPGGAGGPAIELGDRIRAAGLATLVPPASECASACALVWLAGSPRFMASTAHVGFHVPQFDNGTEDTKSLTLSALIGAYETRLGLSDQAIIYTMSKPPQEMRWLEWDDAARLGIHIEPLATVLHPTNPSAH